ncbi:bifunctional non-homologous end joining protein LigD [Prosthecobacter fusiformis]|uniref:DNA ligase (ATP) n=1 Tax=Prosthecobacter fusiformis TaxID=48464 RepID=A0A4R7SRJ0_9BACT|nr:non-homologous end-joining DNA ligase [Prosthecobacter fusiformis]TDU81305.1 bifunctional non-homologous end joining protein LigD [Prosthecobacter fusiformis]
MSLTEYKKKRDFKKTAEPKGKKETAKARGIRRFVVQKHAASRLHYDFRLELDGTLKSWAVPKGIPFAKGEKRLAVEVEDHPISYIDFEGPIPKGEYGGGTVMVWDTGTYEPLSKAPLKELAGGKLHFTLSGSKLNGEWYLVRLRDEKQWLLIRAEDDMKPVTKRMDDTSAISGRNMKQLADADPWISNRQTDKSTGKVKIKRVTKSAAKATAALEKPVKMPAFVEPMKARLVATPPTDDGWIYEVKFDGFRALAFKQGKEVSLISRTEHDMTHKFPEVTEALQALDLPNCILDGEVVALDDKGRSSFQMLQAYELGQEQPPLCYYAFDLLSLKGRDQKSRSLLDRKDRLREILPDSDVVRYSASLEGDASALLKQASKLGLEGLIGKKSDSTYEAGKRSGHWIKLKLNAEQEVVIGGYTPPAGSRTQFGALIVGVHVDGKLQCVGKVGTGFNAKLLRELHAQFQPLIQEKCPFSNLPVESSGRWGQGITKREMKKCTWLKSKLVCQVKFAEWTRDSRLRQPVFVGMREDKRASEVIREKPAS